MSKVAFLDLDNTLYNGYLFQEWMRFLISKPGFSKAVLLALDFKLLLNTLSGFNYFSAGQDVAKGIGKLIKGHSLKEVQKLSEEFVGGINDNYFDYTKPLIKKLKDRGYKVVLVTNEPDILAEAIKVQLEADDAIGLDYKLQDSAFTGEVTNDLFTRFGKEEIVKKYVSTNLTSLESSFALGDSEGDMEMLKLVGNGYLITGFERRSKFEIDHKIRQVDRSKVAEIDLS